MPLYEDKCGPEYSIFFPETFSSEFFTSCKMTVISGAPG